jgi:hypothetical protein
LFGDMLSFGHSDISYLVLDESNLGDFLDISKF